MSYEDGLSKDRSFIVKSDNKLVYLEDSEYPGHFVVWNEESKSGNWLDFAGTSNRPVVEMLDDYSARVTFDYLPESFTFEYWWFERCSV